MEHSKNQFKFIYFLKHQFFIFLTTLEQIGNWNTQKVKNCDKKLIFHAFQPLSTKTPKQKH